MESKQSTMENLVNKEFWKNKKVLITGNTGFKGSWCHVLLNELGADVLGYSRSLVTKPSNYEEISNELNLNTVFADILDRDSLESTINDFRPEIVIHMAAQSIVKTSYEDPFDTINTNIVGTFNVIDASKKSGTVKAFINVTSDKCYENNELNTAFKEGDRLGGKDIYSASKACAEILAKSYTESFLKDNDLNFSLASVRAGNVIGGGDWSHERLIPDIIRSLKNSNLIIRNPNAIRPWQHVLDPIHGYLKLAMSLYSSKDSEYIGGWNFGPNEDSSKSVQWILNESSKLLNNLSYRVEDNVSFSEACFLKLDSTKAKNQLDWHPLWNVEIALDKTLKWYIDHNSKNLNASKLMMNDIYSYWSK